MKNDLQMKNDRIKIPFLPGMVFDDYNKNDHKKDQNFIIYRNTMVEKQSLVKPKPFLNIPHKLQKSCQNLQETQKLLQTLNLHEKENANQEYLQKVIDMNILRFRGYFQQKMIQSNLEKICNRNVDLLYYLEDHTLSIIEPRVQNSGMMQGTLLSRQRVCKQDGQNLTFKDLQIGQPIEIHSKKFILTDCDQCTRSWYLLQDMTLNKSQDIPEDNFIKSQKFKTQRNDDPELKEFKNYCEVSLGGGHQNQGLKKYLEYDRKVLSFDAMWNDQSFAGDLNFYKVNYYLADDKVEVKEIFQPNSGKTNFPLLLKKSKLPKFVPRNKQIGIKQQNQQDFYTFHDLVVGEHIHVYNRYFLLTNCDQFTRDFYKKELGIEQKRIQTEPQNKEIEVNKRKIPPHNGFGSEIDSLGNCYNLIPKPPKIDMHKKFVYSDVILRFDCRMISKLEDDLDKRFLVSFFCEDDSLMIFLKTDKNSGIESGKFLERGKYLNDMNGRRFTTQDFFMGQILNVNKFKFQIVSADNFTLNFMFQKPELFPLCDYQAIFEVLRDRINDYGYENLTINLKQKLGKKKINFGELQTVLTSIGLDNTIQETFTVFYMCDQDEQKRIVLDEFLDIIKNRILK